VKRKDLSDPADGIPFVIGRIVARIVNFYVVAYYDFVIIE
jgi:hypothetical protein